MLHITEALAKALRINVNTLYGNLAIVNAPANVKRSISIGKVYIYLHTIRRSLQRYTTLGTPHTHTHIYIWNCKIDPVQFTCFNTGQAWVFDF